MTDALEDDVEYERRFLVADLAVLNGVEDYEQIEQAYVWKAGGYAIRVRTIRRSDDPTGETQASFTLKGPRKDAHRYELEQPMDPGHAHAIAEVTPHRIRKKRYAKITEGNTWVIDVFEGANHGLIIAEFEAGRGAVGSLKKPWWAGEEVTEDVRYNNEELAANPWPFKERP
ncbi:hypothetical protein [Leekyejoonella antrihumi]|uniref:CYTH domain-containing protein n=1 Tax=Leekyejoonella antrihumi TaxID=1660198 RepID=A0A563DW41_9MICO|nr:hypothetical protein [Leekyejoonella antrihumi]TWP34415.1 hypothetical protein FGL98_17755 [Leekyejoonella antrihumi]